MKTIKDPRHQKRQEAVKALFAESFHPQNANNVQIQNILEKLPEIDKQIQGMAPEFPIDKINKVDLAILRLSVYELTVEKSAPFRVIIDEAIELAKEFGSDNSAAFVNGALGKLIKDGTS